MHRFVQNLAKAELHLHLEGAVPPETLVELAPPLGIEEARLLYEYQNFTGFLQAYARVTQYLSGPKAYGLAARRVFEGLVEQNVRYLELNLSVGVMLWRKQDVEANVEAVAAEAANAGFPVYFLFDAVRQFGEEEAWKVARLAVELKRLGVIAFGIGGDEGRGPVTWFGDVFAFSRDNGLHLAPHAGETTGPATIWDSLRLGAERIGHGIRAIEDAALVEHLSEKRIPLEVCITSNVRTAVTPCVEDHPVRRLFDAGVPVILNTDDPALFECTLNGEYELAARTFGFTEDELRQLAANGFEFAFRK